MEVIRAIAEGLTQLIQADIHFGITGLPYPGGSKTQYLIISVNFHAWFDLP